MAKLTVKEIFERARDLVLSRPGGIRYTEIVRAISDANPETPINTIYTQVSLLLRRFPNEIVKPSRGVYAPLATPPGDGPGTVQPPPLSVEESDFYAPFADWLKNDLDEVTEVAPLGGAAMGKKWGTPDVVGVYKPVASDLVKFQPEIISAEIKIDPQQPVVAFGQAIAYRLFSSKTYIAMPNSMVSEDQARLESLCMLFGVGMVLFELNPKEPNFVIRVRARRFSPDMFYVNEFAERLKNANAELFRRLF
ncbi:MAG: hypothetical protein NTX87_17790 [Planctomycetota bacterium]|nr:hypothetical protein [Planctomycetota bacterium]